MVRKGLLLINLGSPRSPEIPDVKEYLNEFLTDPYVIDLPTPIRQILVKGWIVPKRVANSAEAYKTIWTEAGSPLVNITRAFAEKVRRTMDGEFDVRWAMRYGAPTLQETIESWDIDELWIVPLYPQFADSSTTTALEEAIQHVPVGLKVKIIKDFYVHPAFIHSQVRRIQTHLDQFRPQQLLLSFHGLPEHHMRKRHPEHCLKDPGCCETVGEHNRYCYRAQCLATARAITADLNFPRVNVSVSFQSRLGRRPWIKPYTDYVITALAQQGIKTVSVACPSFTADCLETLEEIQIRLREQFIAAGGEQLWLIPALNDDEYWVSNFCKMVQEMSHTPAHL